MSQASAADRSQSDLAAPLAWIVAGWVFSWLFETGLRTLLAAPVDPESLNSLSWMLETLAYSLVGGLIVGLGIGIGCALAGGLPRVRTTTRMTAAWAVTMGGTSLVFVPLFALLEGPLLLVTSLVVRDSFLPSLLASEAIVLPQSVAIGLCGGYLTARILGVWPGRSGSSIVLGWTAALVAGELVYIVLMLATELVMGGLTSLTSFVAYRVFTGVVTGLVGGWLTLQALDPAP